MSQILSLDSRESQETNKGGISFRLDLTALNVPLHKLRTDSSDAPAQSLGFSASSCERAASPPGVWEEERLTPRTMHGAHPPVLQEGLSRYWGCHCTGGQVCSVYIAKGSVPVWASYLTTST